MSELNITLADCKLQQFPLPSALLMQPASQATVYVCLSVCVSRQAQGKELTTAGLAISVKALGRVELLQLVCVCVKEGEVC